MSDKLLYFPYINVPQRSWTIKSIFYWDQVSAIVPDLYRNEPGLLNRYMRELVELQLVEQIFPDHYLHRIPRFEESFYSILQNPKINWDERRQDFNLGYVSPLHVQKFGERLFRDLVHLGLARENRGDWFMVESKTARAFMMYLATVVSSLDNSTPATDNQRNIDLSLQQNQASNWVHRTRGHFLKDLMPYPVDADLNAIRRFKDRHHEQLRRFRNLLEQTIIDITNIPDKQQRDRKYELKLEEIHDQKEYIQAKLSEVRIGKIVFGSVFGLVASFIGFATGNGFSGTFGLLNSVYSALDGYGNGELLRSPYSYLALTDRSFMANRR